MKTYAIIGNQYEGLYTKPWSDVQKMTQTKPAPKYKGFTTRAEAQTWFDAQKNTASVPARQYTTVYDGDFKANPSHFYMFTDGGSRNTGNVLNGHVKKTDKAAWALAIFRGSDLNHAIFTDTKGYYGRTNNEMEMLALINALLQAKKTDAPITIVSDSKYVLDSVTNWMYNWQGNGWKKASGEIANLAAWQQIYDLIQPMQAQIHFIWVKGHATSAGNTLVDHLLNETMDQL